MKQLFKALSLLVFALLLSVIACRQDDVSDQSENTQALTPKFIIHIQNGDHLRNLNPTIFQKLEETSRHTSALIPTEDTTQGTNFSLDLNTIQIIERNNYTQYTTSVLGHNQQETHLINYMLLDYDDGEQYQFLLKYPRIITDEGIHLDRTNAVMEPISGDVIFQRESVPRGVAPCLEGVPVLVESSQEYQCTQYACTGLGHALGEECECGDVNSSCSRAYEQCLWVVIDRWECSGGGTSGSGTGGATGGNTNNDVNDNTDNDDPLETVPLLSAKEEIERCMNSSLSPLLSQTQLDWFDSIDQAQTITMNNYLKADNCSQEAKLFMLEAVEVMIIENINFEDFMKLKVDNLLVDNPLALLEIDCDQIQQWQTLAQHTAPSSVQSKIDSLPSSWTNDFYIQELDNAGGTAVNMDYFGVKITNLPVKPNTNPPSRYTANEYLNYIRRNFNDFVDGSTFQPYCEIESMCETETNLWASNNPTGSIIYIDIPGDDGVVVCSKYTNSYWYFMTMNSPHAGNHPVSGTRQFGYEVNNDGSYNFFVRGVDRFNNNGIENLIYVFSLGGDVFAGSDDLWESFQTKLKTHVNNNLGTSTTIEPIKNRPDYKKVKKVLKGELPITKLGCDD
ncbi:hypothetical protein U8527_09100 [Kordia algicida OT-1]|uniref:Uncharacterized protein n=1 Tax=Kordia algicida OT-1 TaxID=391587 RepID=A9DU62_9FLAO|nr:hypothetical protein [Kordia algicida]EDP96256.1 hypothetical protein KAOT1_02567 [Kordia algicida OT-1]